MPNFGHGNEQDTDIWKKIFTGDCTSSPRVRRGRQAAEALGQPGDYILFRA